MDSPGDNLLAEFPSVVEAVQCAVAIQRELHARNAELPPQRRMEFRIGINLGDVVVEGERIYGDGVNIAARLEGLAEAGGICISGAVYEQIGTKLALGYEDLGEQAVKNITRPVRVYRVRPEPVMAAATVSQQEEGVCWRGRGCSAQANGCSRRRLAVVPVARDDGAGGVAAPPGGLVAVWWLYVAERAPTLALPDKSSIAVLPFANLNGDPAQEYFSDGMTEVLITDLSKVPAMFVIARDSVFTYRGKAVEVGKVGKQLGVRYVLEGSVLKAGDKVRITAQLIDATTAYHLWSERYDRDLQDIFALQDELTRKILLALRVKLTPEEQARFRHAPTTNQEAYDAYLRGRESYCRMTEEANAEARQLFERAISQVPQHLRFRALLAVSYSEAGREEEARAEAAELLRLNPDYSVEVDRQRLPY